MSASLFPTSKTVGSSAVSGRGSGRLRTGLLGVDLLEAAARREGEACLLAVAGWHRGGTIDPETCPQRPRGRGAVDAAIENDIHQHARPGVGTNRLLDAERLDRHLQ